MPSSGFLCVCEWGGPAVPDPGVSADFPLSPPLPQRCSSGASEAMGLAWVRAAWTSLSVWTHLVMLAEFPLLASHLSLAVQLPRLMSKCPGNRMGIRLNLEHLKVNWLKVFLLRYEARAEDGNLQVRQEPKRGL